MKSYDVVIVGGGPAGVTAALSAKNSYPNKRIALIRKEAKPMIPCGIPYTLFSLKSIDDNILTDAPLVANRIEILNDEAVDRNDHTLILASGEQVKYEKLVLATGSNAVKPSIEGADKEGVFLVKKQKDYLEKLRAAVHSANHVVIIGGGYIGVEVADELLKAGKKVTIVEMMPHLLMTMDLEFARVAEEELAKEGARIITKKSVKRILGGSSVSGVELSDGAKLDCDLVIISVGYRPNLDLIKRLGVAYQEAKGVLVDNYLRTSEEDIFAVGDCAIKNDFFTGDLTNIMLASTAMAEGRLVGSNLYSIKVVRQYQGVLGTFSTKIGNTAFAVTGMTEARASQKGIDYTVGTSKAVDRHPGKLPGASEVYVKLIFSTYSHTLLGAEIYGGNSVGELINMVSVMILNRMTDTDINTLQIGTHPLLTPSPVAYPVINATIDAIVKWFQK
ncbi:MAG: NAD(P)/FAD-dependent oxidoreductase [Candidatus Kryptoniota bacterium]